MEDVEEYAIGIDLGTTNCCVAVYRQGRVEIIPSNMGQTTTPSHISVSETAEVTVGEVSKRDHKGEFGTHYFNMKRLIGRRYEDKQVQDDIQYWPFHVINDGGRPKVDVYGSPHRPEEISALILMQLKKEAETYLLGRPVTKAVITVPAYFSSSQRQATKNAGKLAGFDVLRIINEPTAAALGFNYRFPFEPPEDRNFLVFDLGGGTFDIVIISLTLDGHMRVKAVGGDTHLGGEDFDNEMVSHCANEFKKVHHLDPLQPKDGSRKAQADAYKRLQRLKYECEVQKTFLSAANHTTVNIDYFYNGEDLSVKITRRQLNEMNANLFDKCISIMDGVIRSADMDKSDIHNVIMVGGSTKIPEVRRRVEEYFQGKNLNYEISGDEAVAYGAALQAAIMTGKLNLNVQLQDVIPLPIGIDSYNRTSGIIEFFELITRNTPLPCLKESNFSARHEGQDNIVTNILEGISKIPSENHLIATFHCSKLPHRLSKDDVLTIELSVDGEGILKILAKLNGAPLPDELVINGFLHPVKASELNSLNSFTVLNPSVLHWSN